MLNHLLPDECPCKRMQPHALHFLVTRLELKVAAPTQIHSSHIHSSKGCASCKVKTLRCLRRSPAAEPNWSHPAARSTAEKCQKAITQPYILLLRTVGQEASHITIAIEAGGASDQPQHRQGCPQLDQTWSAVAIVQRHVIASVRDDFGASCQFQSLPQKRYRPWKLKLPFSKDLHSPTNT